MAQNTDTSPTDAPNAPLAPAMPARIDAALTELAAALKVPSASSDHLLATLSPARRLLAEAEAWAAATAEGALSPELDRDTARRARGASAVAKHDLARLRASISKLEAKVDERLTVEAEEERVRSYERARDMRDDAARLLREQYPGLRRQLVEIEKAIEEADVAVAVANRHLPDGWPALDRTQGHVQGFQDRRDGREPFVRAQGKITKAIQLLPDLDAPLSRAF